MDLIYSMRRKPLKCEPPHFENPLDTEVVRPIVTISVCNIIAFSSPTELSDADGDTWGGHVYVCDLDTPWDCHKVTSTVHPVSALEWDNEGKQLLVGTTAGDVSVYGQKEYLLNEWTCLYSATFPGEHIIRAIFFHNGRRVVAIDKKPDALITEKFQLLRSAPTLKGFGGGRSGGALVVSSSGLVGAVWGGDSARALHAAEPLPPARLRVTTAAMAHKSGGIVVAAGCGGGGGGGGRWCVRCAVAKPRAPPHLALQPLPALYLPTAGDHPVTISWCLRDDIDCLLVAGTTLTLWKLTEGAHPVHKLLSKGPLQGSTTPNGGPKPGSDCFNTVVWQPSSPWILEEGEGAVKVSGHKLQLAPPYVLMATPRNLHLLSRDKHHVICSRAVPLNASVSETPTVAGTPPKKPKYGPGALQSSSESCATVCGMDTSYLGGVVAAIDTHARLHVYTLPYCADVPSPVAIQHTCNLLEYCMVSGIDCLDVLMTIKSGLVEPIYESFTESFLRQTPTFQQYYYHNWLKIRIALCRLIPSLSTSASWLTAMQMCHYAWGAALPALRPDDRPEHNLILSLDDGDTDKTLLALEAKPECLGDVSSLQPLRRQLQRALDIAVTALLSLQHSTHQSHGYELWSDASAVIVLRKLVVLARASGRGGDALSRPLARLHATTAKHELQEECASLWGQSVNGARSWEGAPRCSITAPHGRSHPLYLEYGVEPEGLKFTPEPPPYLQADVPPPRQMDTIRYMYLGGGGLPAKCKQCGRCGALAAYHSTHHHRHALLAAADARLTHRCRCGGKWTLVSNV